MNIKLTLKQKVAARCCAIILSVDSNRGNEKQTAEFIAEEYKIDLDKLRAGKYNVHSLKDLNDV